MLVLLNLLLAGGGIALIHEYLSKRDRAAQAAGLAESPKRESAQTAAEIEGVRGETKAPAPQGQGDSPPDEEPAPSASEDTATEIPASGVTEQPASNPEVAKSPAPIPAPNAKDEQPASPKNSRPPDPKPADAEAKPRPPPPSPPASVPPDAGPFAAPPPNEVDEAERVRTLSAKISLVVSRHQSQLSRCYQSAAKVNNPSDPLEGRIRVQFAVHPDGFARSIGVVSNDTGSIALSKCIVGLVGSWTFPSSGGDALEFVWPFDFQAPK